MFFTYANTVATIDFAKKFKGHGWMGIDFKPIQKKITVKLLHVRFHQSEDASPARSVGFNWGKLNLWCILQK